MRGKSNWLTVLLAIFMTVHFAPTADAADMVPWVADLQTAQQMASAQNQLILLHFYADNCPPCRRLEKNVFSQAGFGHGVARNYVPVRINATVSPDLARKFHVEQWPTDLMITAKGEEVHRMTSPQDVNEYLRALNQIAWRVNSMPAGVPIQQMPQGFADSSGSSTSNAGASPFHFTQPTPQHSYRANTAGQAHGMGQAHAAGENEMRRYDLGGAPGQHRVANHHASANQFGGSPNVANAPSPPAMQAQQAFITNQYAAPGANPLPGYANVPQMNGMPSSDPMMAPQQGLSPQDAIARARQQIALAQQQIAQAQSVPQRHARPQAIENHFVKSNPSATGTYATGPYEAGANPAHPGSPSPNMQPPDTPLAAAGPSTEAITSTGEVANPEIPPLAVGDPNSQIAVPSSTSAVSSPAWTPSSVASNGSPPASSASPQDREPVSAANDFSEMGMEGYCPVSVIDEDRWVKGDKRWGAHHRGRLYLFHTAAAQQKFLAAPDRYSPVLAGFDPVAFAARGEYSDGRRAHGIRYKDRIFLFDSEESLSQFTKTPRRFAEVAQQAIGGNRILR